VDLRRAMKEPFHAGVCARVSEFAGRAGGNDALAVFVEHDAPGDNLEDARELVGYDHYSQTENAIEYENQIVQLDRRNRVEPG